MIGVCGYEISDLYFQFSYQASDGEQSHAVCALMTEDGSRYAGQLAGNRSGYAPDLDGPLTVSKQGAFSLVSNGDNDFVGVVKLLDIGQSQHMVAALLPDGIYYTYVHQQQTKTVLLLLAVSVLAVGLSIFLGNRYVTPLLRSMEQVKTEQLDSATRIPEVNDLLAYLAERDRLNESTLDEIRREQVSTQASLAQLQTEHDRLQERLRQLAQSKRTRSIRRSTPTSCGALRSCPARSARCSTAICRGCPPGISPPRWASARTACAITTRISTQSWA